MTIYNFPKNALLFHVMAVFLAALSVELIGQSSCSAQSEAKTYQMNSQHSGATEAPNYIFPLEQKWSVSLGGDLSYPLIGGGRIFIESLDSTLAEIKLYALSEVDGHVIWGPLAVGSANQFSGSAYDNGKVYVAADNGLLQAFSAPTGSLLWTAVLPFLDDCTDPPIAYDGTVYVAGDAYVYAVSEANGVLIWKTPIDTYGSPAADSTGLYLAQGGQLALKLSLTDGRILWWTGHGGSGTNTATGVVFDEGYFIRNIATIQANGTEFNTSTGAINGTFTAGTAPAFDQGIGVFMTGNAVPGYNNALVVDQLTTNTQLWSVAGSTTNPFVTAPIIANGAVFEGTANGNLVAYGEDSGNVLWQANVGSAFEAPDEGEAIEPLTGLAAAGGLVVVPASGRLVAFGSESRDISSMVSIQVSSLSQTGTTWAGTITITNISGTKLLGPFDVVLTNLAGAQLLNRTAAFGGAPYILLMTDSLAKDQSASVRVEFSSPNPTFTVKTYSGIL